MIYRKFKVYRHKSSRYVSADAKITSIDCDKIELLVVYQDLQNIG